MTTSLESLLTGTVDPGLFSWRGPHDVDVAAEAVVAGWEVLHVDTSCIVSMEEFYARLVDAWGLPHWFGRNLDALFDAMLDRVTAAGRTLIVWDGLPDLMAVEPIGCVAVLDLLNDAVAVTDRLAVIVRGDLGVSGFAALR